MAMNTAELFRTTWVHCSALWLACLAQGVRGGNLQEIATRACALPLLPCQIVPDLALRGAARGCRVVSWFGGLNSCLARSLVAGALLSDQVRVLLHIGFRDGCTDPLSGHAWLSLNGAALESGADRFVEVLQLEMSRFPRTIPMHPGADNQARFIP